MSRDPTLKGIGLIILCKGRRFDGVSQKEPPTVGHGIPQRSAARSTAQHILSVHVMLVPFIGEWPSDFAEIG